MVNGNISGNREFEWPGELNVPMTRKEEVAAWEDELKRNGELRKKMVRNLV